MNTNTPLPHGGNGLVEPEEGSIGLRTMGQAAAPFDGLPLLNLVSNRTRSGQAAN